MKKSVLRFCSGLLAVILLSVTVVPCYAVTDEYTSTGTFWSSLKEKWWLGFGSKFLIGQLADSACSVSPDSRHHGSLKTYVQNSDGSYTAICNYCSADFPVYDADLSAAYDNYVETLPAQGYNSDGSILWSPKINFMAFWWKANPSSYYYCPHGVENEKNSLTERCLASFNCEKMSFTIRPSSGNDAFSFGYVYLAFKDVYPIDGYYTRVSSLVFSENSITYDSKPVTFECSYEAETSAPLHYAGVAYDYSPSFKNGGYSYQCH